MIKDIKEYESAAPTKLTVKEVATNTEESNVENVSTSTSDMLTEKKSQLILKKVMSKTCQHRRQTCQPKAKTHQHP